MLNARTAFQTFFIVVGSITSISAIAQEARATNASSGACPSNSIFTWHISAPSLFPVIHGEAIPIDVSVGGCKATGVKITSQRIYEKVLGAKLADLTIGNKPDEHLGVVIDKDSTGTLNLVQKTFEDDGQSWWSRWYPEYGGFSGILILAADQLPKGEEVKVDIAITSWPARLIGVLALAIGVFGSSFLTPLVPDPAADAATGTVRSLRDRIAALRGKFHPTPDRSQMEEALNQHVERLINVSPEVPQPTRGNLIDVSTRLLLHMSHSEDERNRSAALRLSSARAQILVSLTSIALGLNSLVLTTSFGTPKDYFACLLYGLGAPLGSKAITSLVALAAR